jgi:hypothetical protein
MVSVFVRFGGLVHRASAGAGVALEVGRGVLVGLGVAVGPLVGVTGVSVGPAAEAVGVAVGTPAEAVGELTVPEPDGLAPDVGVGDTSAA